TYGATGELPAAADERQYEVGHGPCVDAAQGNQWTIVADCRTDDRWPDVTGPLATKGLLSSMSIPLPLHEGSVGALNSYARTPRAFDESDVPLGEQFAALAAVTVANARSYIDAARAAEGMREAMRSRSVIEQAKGIIIGRTGCSPERAFELLVQQSQHENRKLREVAASLVAQAGGPRPPAAPAGG
ncbi:MAG TPA: GAF and ANTAR domain-containing protein, partial [Acidimicrobiales bacterium]|nr:GAF and ANTAR domain-containing protein [Acidimicrobiales bacterium]